MTVRGIQSESYRKLLEQQKQEDEERKAKLEELRKKQLREEIKRKRDEEEARKKALLLKERKELEAKQAKIDLEAAELETSKKLEALKRKQPLSATEAKDRRERAETARNAKGLSQLRHELPIQRPVLSSRYSDLLAKAPTKLPPIESKPATPPVGRSRLLTEKTTKTPKDTSGGTSGKISPLKRDRSSTDNIRSRPSSATPNPISTARRKPLESPTSTHKSLQTGTHDLQPLQKVKRDLRTIEQIQNDLHRRMGKDYAHLKQSPAETSPAKSLPSHLGRSILREAGKANTMSPQKSSRPVQAPLPSRSSAVQRPRDSQRREREVHDGTLGESIWDILNPGKKRAQYLARDIDSDDEMEANAADIRREELRAEKAARLEDEREARALKEAEAKKAMKRRKLGA